MNKEEQRIHDLRISDLMTKLFPSKSNTEYVTKNVNVTIENPNLDKLTKLYDDLKKRALDSIIYSERIQDNSLGITDCNVFYFIHETFHEKINFIFTFKFNDAYFEINETFDRMDIECDPLALRVNPFGSEKLLRLVFKKVSELIAEQLLVRASSDFLAARQKKYGDG